MSTDHAPIRSYQRIFKPERRIYQVEGHLLPVPGGVPLRWLGSAIAGLLAVVVLCTRPGVVAAVGAALVAVYALLVGTRAGAPLAAAAVFCTVHLGGWLLGMLDWPLRLIIVPALLATLATHATPDGRSAHRFVRSWLGLQLRPARRSLARPLPALDERRDVSGRMAVAPDWRAPVLRRARLCGPARVVLTSPVSVRRASVARRRLIAKPCPSPAETGGVHVVELAGGETLELRP
jgi:hypothetical protein